MKDEGLHCTAGPTRDEPAARPWRGALHHVRRLAVENPVHGPFAPKDVVARVEGHGRTLDPADATAQSFLLAIFGTWRDDDDFVARPRTGFELLIDVGADASAELRVELSYVDDLHGARRISSGTRLVCNKPRGDRRGRPELCSRRRGL